MLADDLFQSVPHFRTTFFDHLLDALDGGHLFVLLQQFPKDERLEQLQGHLLWQPTLVELEFWSHDNNGAPRVIYPLP